MTLAISKTSPVLHNGQKLSFDIVPYFNIITFKTFFPSLVKDVIASIEVKMRGENHVKKRSDYPKGGFFKKWIIWRWNFWPSISYFPMINNGWKIDFDSSFLAHFWSILLPLMWCNFYSRMMQDNFLRIFVAVFGHCWLSESSGL